MELVLDVTQSCFFNFTKKENKLIQKEKYNVRVSDTLIIQKDTRLANGSTFSPKILDTIIQPFMHFNILIFIVQIMFNQIKNANVKYFCFFKKVMSQPLFFLKKLNLKNFINLNNMAKQTKSKTEQSRQITTHYQVLKELPTTIRNSQCVLHKHELFICGVLIEELVILIIYSKTNSMKLVDSNSNNDKDNNQITLLSFGGNKDKHTLVMKYVSVWSDDNNNDEYQNENETNKSKKFNK
ncbi:hypothetical protein RFI_20488 [Reticulomyxa filosa]|uniref:Uncharacterized protein n=1 Tax=Reticulomyxa filosa TaxID=46433 RepID=X6MUS3_RETFI|nr:hypothetical protein RFI_20488 [Reticulomyxa filosa]|eukprot:ETO16850.1 hypothetical protein RFI_20488 [Reticulomyxa filosa]